MRRTDVHMSHLSQHVKITAYTLKCPLFKQKTRCKRIWKFTVGAGIPLNVAGVYKPNIKLENCDGKKTPKLQMTQHCNLYRSFME